MSTQGGDRSNVDRSGPGTDRSGPKEAASQRVTVPSQYPEYNISVTTEQTAPGTWKAVATVTHVTDQAVQATPVPLTDEAFPDAGAAHARAVAAASEWIADNMPHA